MRRRSKPSAAGTPFKTKSPRPACTAQPPTPGSPATLPTAEAARRYARQRHLLFAADLVWTVLLLVGLQATGLSFRWTQTLRSHQPNEWLVVGGYALLIGLASTVWFLPWKWYGGFVVEHRFGLSNQTWPRWWWHEAKGLAVGGVVWVALMEGGYAILRTAGPAWWLWAAAGWFVVTVGLTRIMPTVLLPLFYKTQPLTDRVLGARLLRLLERMGLPAMGIYTVRLSQQTKKANAALAGLGKSRRILLADTLVEHYTPEEIEVVLAHELGHHRLGHVRWHLLVGALTAAAGFFLVDRLWRWVGPVSGAASLADVAAFPVIALLLFGLSLVLLPFDNGLSRAFERQADAFALRLTRLVDPFISAMQKLAQQNLAEVSPPRWVEWLLYDHPAIARRIRTAELFRASGV